MGFCSCAAIVRDSEHDPSALPKLVKIQTPDVISYLEQFAGLYASEHGSLFLLLAHCHFGSALSLSISISSKLSAEGFHHERLSAY